MKSLFTLLVAFAVSASCFGQYESKPETSETRAQAVYGEFLGTGVTFSVHYDFRFAKKQNGFGARVGLGFFGGSDGGILTIPVGINHLAGKGPHYFESGIGVTYGTGFSGDDFGEDAGFLMTPTVGYRYMPLVKGFTAKIYIGPLIFMGEGGGWFMFGGFGLGYKF